MPYTVQALPSAKAERAWLCETYGIAFSEKLAKWLRWLVDAVENDPHNATIVPLQWVIENSPSPYEFAMEKFRSASLGEQAQAILTFLSKRRPMWESLVARVRVQNDRYWITLDAFFEVNHGSRKVVFTKLEFYGDGIPTI